MSGRLQRVWQRLSGTRSSVGLRFERPLVLFQSDDWGRIGVRDHQGWEKMRDSGIALGESPHDFYSLETAADLMRLSGSLRKHRDSIGRSPSIGMNFITANVDFDRCFAAPGQEIPLVPLVRGFPGNWERPGLFEAYRQGIEEGLFSAGLHGLTHFCERAVRRELVGPGERAELIKTMWRAQTPYIYRRMPWIGYEYWDAEGDPQHRFLSIDDQRTAIRRAAEIYEQLFKSKPVTACAPGYRANADTNTVWFEVGIRVAQNGPDEGRGPHFDERGMLQTFRTVEMEPANGECDASTLLETADYCLRHGIPAIVSIHSINFHSTLKDFLTPTLSLLEEFLTRIEKNWPNLLYINDEDLFRIACGQSFLVRGKRIDVGVIGAGAKN
jgi:hypothetical protein